MMEMESGAFVSPSQAEANHQQMVLGNTGGARIGMGLNMGVNSSQSAANYYQMRTGHQLSHHNLSLMNLNQIPSQSQLAATTAYSQSVANAQSAAFHGSLSNINLITSLAQNEQQQHQQQQQQQQQRPSVTVDYAAPNENNGVYRQNGSGPLTAPVYPSRPASASASLLATQSNNQSGLAQRYAQQTAAQNQSQTSSALLMVAPQFSDGVQQQNKLLSPAHAALWGRAALSPHLGSLPGAPIHSELGVAGVGGSVSPSDSCGSQSNTASCPQGGPGGHSGAYALVHKKRRYKEVAVMQPDGNGQPTYVCGVCGDRALGYNFDAITCESCKAFFRRNAQKMKPLKCNFDGNCKIDSQTRKFCPGCRLKKCIAIGMRREWILSEEQLALRRQKGRANKVRRQQQQFHHSLQHAGLPGLLLPGNAAGQFGRMPDENCYDASSTQRSASRSSSVCSSPSAEAQAYRAALDVKPLVENPAIQSAAAGALSVQVSNAMRAGSVWSEVSPQAEHYINAAGAAAQGAGPASGSWSVLRPLSEVDTILLEVLQRLLYEVMEAVVDNDLLDESQDRRIAPPDIVPHVGNYLKLTDSFIRRFIKFCKCVPEFAQLRQDDQIALLKGGVMEAIVLRGALLFEPTTRRWQLRCPWTSDNQLQALSVECMRGFLEPFAEGDAFLQSYLQFLDSLFELTQRNRLLMLLLLLIELFSSDRAGLVNKLQISQAQEKYLSLLRHFLESLFDHATVRRLFPSLLLKLADARDVASGLNRIFTKVDWSNVEPLLGEMFAPFTKR